MELSTRVDRLELSLEQLAAAQARTELEIRELAAAQARTDQQLRELAAAQARTEQRIGELATAQGRTEDRLVQLAEAQRAMLAAQERTEAQLAALAAWQRGESGRREGEALERQVLRRAPVLFYGGAGGTPDQADVRARLSRLVLPHLDAGAAPDRLTPEDDPFLADLIWWKGDRLAVVEVSIVIDRYDVDRAHRRAATLRRGGADVLPILVGDVWADGQIRSHAAALGLVWKVGDDLSERFIDFRRLPG